MCMHGYGHGPRSPKGDCAEEEAGWMGMRLMLEVVIGGNAAAAQPTVTRVIVKTPRCPLV
jgi:hypothetical protein